jgi:endothelin-converting enzyme/putative endopeptidase
MPKRLATLLCVAALSLTAQESKPLSQLPFTPVLDPKFMDTSVDPCVDFYKYACGKWNQLNPIPADEAGWDVYSKLNDENQRYLWGILLQTSQPEAKRSANEQKIGDLFEACMNGSEIESAGMKPLEPALAEIARLQNPDDVSRYVAGQHRDGKEVLFEFGPGQDYNDSSRMIPFADAGGLGLPDRDYYTDTSAKSQEIRKRYVQHVAQMLRLLGEASTQADADAQSIMAIETALAKASLTRTEQRNPYNLKHMLTQDDLRHLTPAFDWDVFFEKVQSPSSGELNVSQPKFFTQMNHELSSEPMPAWRAYLRWHVLHDYARYLPSTFENEDFDFYSRYLRGVKEMPPRWKKCTRLVNAELPDALGRVFVERTFSPETKQSALLMVENVEREMESDIRTLPWMSDASKQQALLKLHAVVNKIGYPNKWRDYSSVEVRRDDLFGDLMRAEQFEERRQLNKIGKPVDREEWFMPPPTVNAYYDPQMNDINFPAGVLQPPLFDPKEDSAPNYGNTGATMGHELTHGFDDEGRQFDAKGNLRDWWTPQDGKAFEERVDCVRQQYAKYIVVDDIHINSSLTLGEDVADLGGTLLAYIAWQHATAGQDATQTDSFTPQQRFFIGMAQWACGDERPENKRVHAITDPHSPLEFRVNGVVSNLPQFAGAFGCKAGQPMVRANACRVW